ncbi:MAG TPA: AMP-binding protein [Solirubrobacterales bacterium]|jgi:fatty-acyl-CoA synthase|nr:AMP-binding protein [Solirubrobacterales bacterium]
MTALSPLSFLRRSAGVWAERPAVHLGERTWSFARHAERAERVADALQRRFSLAPGSRVAAILPNLPAMLELHYAVPGARCVLVPLNPRLAAPEYAYILDHCGAELVFADAGLRGVLEPIVPCPIVWVDHANPEACPYEALIAAAEPRQLVAPEDEDELLSINYTSGTTGQPKGVMATHRGAYLHSLGVIAEAGLSARSRYLWTLPMFHCNGWAYTWAVTAAGAAHVCLPRLDPAAVWRQIGAGVTHFCAAPTVLGMILDAEEKVPVEGQVRVFVGGAPPAPAELARAADLGLDVTHLYGLTETYGPLVVCAWNPNWDALPVERQYALKARQGVSTVVSEPVRVVDGEMRDVPADGETVGELVMRGNNVTPGYYRDAAATAAAFEGGWFHSGDLGVMHSDGYVEIRDRFKDVVISGGENISSIEVEQALVAHSAVAEAAVIGIPDERWGELLVAYVTVRPGIEIDPEQVRGFLRTRLTHFKIPKQIRVVEDLPKTATGKIRKHVLRAQT